MDSVPPAVVGGVKVMLPGNTALPSLLLNRTVPE
jgi:hypothetical protein